MMPGSLGYLVVLFSGGKTSALMAKLVKTHPYFRQYTVFYVFCNTGLEMPETLDFVDAVDKAYGLGLIWLEAVVNPGKGNVTTHRIVTYETATRDKSIWEAVCAKYGIPSKYYGHCTREMKIRPADDFMRLITDNYKKAIGIRADEPGRLGNDPQVIYPLARLYPTTKAQVNNFWAGQPFTLGIPSHYGNCVFCFKKSKRKKLTIAKERPELVQPFAELEEAYADPENDREQMNVRDKMSVRDFLAEAQQPFEPFVDAPTIYNPQLDMESPCVCG